MAAGEPELCTSRPFGHLRHIQHSELLAHVGNERPQPLHGYALCPIGTEVACLDHLAPAHVRLTGWLFAQHWRVIGAAPVITLQPANERGRGDAELTGPFAGSRPADNRDDSR
jgi:hypothetical protein